MKRVNKFLAILLAAGLCGNGTVGAVRLGAGMPAWYESGKAYNEGDLCVGFRPGENPNRPRILKFISTERGWDNHSFASINPEDEPLAKAWDEAAEEARYLDIKLTTEDGRSTLSTEAIKQAIAAKRAAELLAAYQQAKHALTSAGLGYTDDNINATWTTKQLKGLCEEQIDQSAVPATLPGWNVEVIIQQAQEARARNGYARKLGVSIADINPQLSNYFLEQLVTAGLKPSAAKLRTMTYEDAEALLEEDRAAKEAAARQEVIARHGLTNVDASLDPDKIDFIAKNFGLKSLSGITAENFQEEIEKLQAAARAAREKVIAECGYEDIILSRSLTTDMIRRLHDAGATREDVSLIWDAAEVEAKIAELAVRKELAEAMEACGYDARHIPHGFTADMIRACKDAGLNREDLYSVDPHDFENSLAALKEVRKAQQKENMRLRTEAIKRAKFNAADVHASLSRDDIEYLAHIGITPTQEITHDNFITKIAKLQEAQREAALKEVEAAGFDRAVIVAAEHANPAEIKKQLKKRLALVKELTRRGINPDTVVKKATDGEEDSHDLLFKNMPKKNLKFYLKHGIDGSDMPTEDDIAKHCNFDDVVTPKIRAKEAALEAADAKLRELSRELDNALAALEAKEDGEDAAPAADVFADVRKAFDAFMKDEYAKTPKFGTEKPALKSTLVTGFHKNKKLGDRDEMYVAGRPIEIRGMVFPGLGHLKPRNFERRGLLSKLEWNIKVLERKLIEDADAKAFNAKCEPNDDKAPELESKERAKLEKQHKDLVALRDAWYDVVYPAVDGKEGKNAGKKLDRHAAATLLARLARGKAGRGEAKREKEDAERRKEAKRKQTLGAKFQLGQTNIILERLEKTKPADETSDTFKAWKKDREALAKLKAFLEKMVADATPKTPAQVVAAEAELWANKAMALKVRAARYREIAQATTASERNQLRALVLNEGQKLHEKLFGKTDKYGNVEKYGLRNELMELRAKRTVANMLEKEIADLEAKIKATEDRLDRFREALEKAEKAVTLDDAAYADLAKLVQEAADELDAQAGKYGKHSSTMNNSWTVAQVAKVDAAIIGAALILQNILEGYAGELPADEDKRTTGQKVKEALAAILSVKRYVNSLKAFGRVFVPAKRGKKAPGFGSRLKTFGKEKTIFATGLGAATAFTGYVGAQAIAKKAKA